MSEEVQMTKITCRHCKWLCGPPTTGGKRVVHRAHEYPCYFDVEPLEAETPACIEPLKNRYKRWMKPDEKHNCPVFEELK